MQSVKNIKNLSGKRVLMRVDFNVPTKDGKVLDDLRIKRSLPTINYLLKKNAKVILISHFGRNGDSIKPVFKVLKKYIKSVSFLSGNLISESNILKINSLKKGEVVLLENLRTNEGEESNSPIFARGISRYGDIYVNDAFSVCHRNHASIISIPKHLPSYAGFSLLNEVDNLSKSFNSKHPFTFILGGAKFETKIPLVKKFINKADYLYIGGAIANDFLKVKGYDVGQSLIGGNMPSVKTFTRNKKIILPTDVIVSRSGRNLSVKVESVEKNDVIADIGSDSVVALCALINKSKFILWNGPLGKYEDGFDKASKIILKKISNSKAFSIIGGGDTASLVSRMKLENKISFVSSAGGATLEFLAKGTLPGLKALK